MASTEQIKHWLAKYQTNGVMVDLPELVAFQTFINRLNLSPNKDIASSLAGGERSKLKGRGMEFDEARHYQPGDDIRAIDWRVTARTGKTHTKVYREERERPVLIMIDLMRSMNFGTEYLCKSVQACHLASLITWNAIKRGDKVGGLFFSDDFDKELKPKANTKSAFSLLQAMLDAQNRSSQTANDLLNKSTTQNSPETIYVANLNRLRYLAKPGSLVYLISDFNGLPKQGFDIIGSITRHCEVKSLLINDPMELALPNAGIKQNVSITDGFHRHELTLGENTSSEHYRLKQSEHFLSIKNEFDKLNIALRSITASKPIELQINRGELGELL